MTAVALGILHGIGAVFAGLLFLFMLAFIAGVTVCCVFRPRTNGYARRYRLPKNRAPRRTLIVTPENRDPHIVGDVSQAHWPKATYPHSRANVKGEG